MNAFACRLLHTLCRTLAPEEREIFLGDIEELQLGGRAAIASLTGLIVRRQAQAWKHWRPWLVLVGLILPATLLLAHATSVMAEVDSLLLWMYASNWTPAFLSHGWILYAFIPEAAGVAYFWMAMACWSWTAGFVIAAVSRMARWINACLMAFVLLLATVSELHHGGSTLAALFAQTGRAPMSPGWFYHLVFPALLLVLLVLLPAIVGMRKAHHADEFPPRLRKLLYAAIAMTAFSSQGSLIVRWLLQSVPHQFGIFRVIGLTPLAFAAPVTYWVMRRRLRTAAGQKESSLPTEA